MPQTDYYIPEILVLTVGGVFLGLCYRGLFDPRTFAHAPKRSGRLAPADLMISVGLWLIGGTVGPLLVKQALGEVDDARGMLWMSIAAAVGWLPMVGYVVVRSRAVFDEKLAGLGLRFDRLGWSLWQTFKVTMYIIPATLATMFAIHAVVTALGHELPRIAHGMLEQIATSDDRVAVVGLCVVAVGVAPVVEELLFRGVFQSTMRHLLPEANRWLAIGTVSVVFALIHLGSALPVVLPAYVVLAMGLGYVYERTGRLWAPIFIHAAFNALNLALVFAPQPNEVAP